MPARHPVPAPAARNPSVITDRVLSEVLAERIRQNAKWGEQNHPDGTGRPGDASFAEAYKAICKANGPGEDTWRDILAEEVYEAFAESAPIRLRAELIQVAAVAVAQIEAIDRRIAAAAAAYVPPAHYMRDGGVECCVHTIPVGPGSCPDCWDLVKWDVLDGAPR